MTSVHFYTLSSERYDNSQDLLIVVCRLTEKAMNQGHHVYIQTASRLQAQQLNDLMWQFKNTSFVPHKLSSEEDSIAEIVTLGERPPDKQFNDVLVNLTDTPVENVKQYNRVNELVGPDDASLSRGRERYRHYQGQEIEISTHKL